jgi:hypothetical protein
MDTVILLVIIGFLLLIAIVYWLAQRIDRYNRGEIDTFYPSDDDELPVSGRSYQFAFPIPRWLARLLAPPKDDE